MCASATLAAHENSCSVHCAAAPSSRISGSRISVFLRFLIFDELLPDSP